METRCTKMFREEGNTNDNAKIHKSTKTKQEPDGEDGPSITTAGLQPHSSMTVTQRATGWKVETQIKKNWHHCQFHLQNAMIKFQFREGYIEEMR